MFAAVNLEFSGPFSWLASDPATFIFEAAIEVIFRSSAVLLSLPLYLAA